MCPIRSAGVRSRTSPPASRTDEMMLEAVKAFPKNNPNGVGCFTLRSTGTIKTLREGPEAPTLRLCRVCHFHHRLTRTSSHDDVEAARTILVGRGDRSTLWGDRLHLDLHSQFLDLVLVIR